MGDIYKSGNVCTSKRGVWPYALLSKIVCSVLAMVFAIFYATTSYSAVVIQEFESSKAFKTQLTGLSRVKHKNPDAAEGKYAALWNTLLNHLLHCSLLSMTGHLQKAFNFLFTLKLLILGVFG